MVHEWG